MLNHHIALVAENSNVQLKELTKVAAALQKQVTRDFGPLWRVEADVSAFQSLDEIPLDYWPVIVMDDIGDPSAEGFHTDQQGQPYSLVRFSDTWTLTASHEALEMLADPFGRRLIAGKSPVAGQGRVKFLVEVCDPCEATNFDYTVNGIPVSDFYTPHYFDPVAASGVRYSLRGSIKEPRQVLKGGYLSWYDHTSRSWWQRTWFGGSHPSDKELGALKIADGNIRAAIDRATGVERLNALKAFAKAHEKVSAKAAKEDEAPFIGRADMLRASIKKASRPAG